MATLTTPGWALPYPDGAERVMDGDNAIGALANATDAALSTVDATRGVVVSGLPIVGAVAGSAAVVQDLNTVITGPASWLDLVNDRVVIPAGADGWYVLEAYVTSDKGTLNAPGCTFTLQAGAAASPGTVLIATSFVTGAIVRATFTGSIALVAGDIVRILAAPPSTGAAMDFQIRRLTVRRVGKALSPTALDLGAPDDDEARA